MSKLLVLNGPNLNLLGSREPEHYGATPLSEILSGLSVQARNFGTELHTFQSNAEHELVEQVQNAPAQGVDFIIINPAAFTHTSVALRDAFRAVEVPFIEVHLSNVHAREEFRKHSYLSDIAVGVISGLGPIVYDLALQAAVRHLRNRI